jgi:hypothetical protein
MVASWYTPHLHTSTPPHTTARSSPTPHSHTSIPPHHRQVISHLYEIYGEKVASMLDGFFAFVVRACVSHIVEPIT